MNKFTSTWAVVVSVIILLALKVYNPIPLQTLQLKTFDLYQKFGNNYQSKSLVLIDISDNSLNLYGQWPWKRDQLGRAVIKAYQNGAALVFLNVVFVHKDRLGGDEMFLKMISKYPVILTETKDAKNLISIKRKVLGVGNVDVPIDVDGTIRKLPLENSVPETILKIIKFKIPKQDDIWIDFRHQIPRIDHAELDWSSVKGKIVFIGATFSGSTYVLTPDGLKNPHDIMAMSTETLLSGKYITRPDWLPKLEWIGFILGLLAFVLIIPRVGLLWSAVLLFVAYADIAIGSVYLWHSKMIITDWSYIAIAMTIVWTHLIYNNFARENRLKLQIKKQFEHYLEPKMVKKLQQNPDLLKLGGETKELTFLFCDIRGFTPLSEKYQKNPAELTKVINRNSTIPTQRSELFSTAVDNQPNVEIHVLQGEREFADDNKSLGKFRLNGIRPARRGEPQIQVSFDLDVDGVLSVKANDKDSGEQQSIVIEGASTLDKKEIEEMIQNAEKFASADKERREKVNLKTKAYNLIDEYEKLTNTTENLSEDLKNKVTEFNPEITNLKELVTKELSVVESNEINKIITKVEQIISQITSENEKENDNLDK